MPDSRRRRAFVSDGSVHRKTLGLADNLLSGPLPAWALRRSALDDALVVLLQARPRAARRRQDTFSARACRTSSREVTCVTRVQLLLVGVLLHSGGMQISAAAWNAKMLLKVSPRTHACKIMLNSVQPAAGWPPWDSR